MRRTSLYPIDRVYSLYPLRKVQADKTENKTLYKIHILIDDRRVAVSS